MTYFFTENAAAAVNADNGLFTNAHIGIALYHQAPVFTKNDPRYIGIDTVAELSQQLGWQEAVVEGYPIDNEVVVSTRDSSDGKSRYVMLDEFPLDAALVPVQVRAVAFYFKGTLNGVNNGLLFVSNTPVSPVQALEGGDFIAPRPDTAFTTGDSRWLLNFALGTSAGSTLGEGPLALMRAAPTFEPSHTQHVWLYPQRVNFIANPSFEKGTNHWRGNGAVSRINTTLPNAGVWAGQFASVGGVAIAESNKFPAIDTNWTIQLMATGPGTLRVGLVTWPIEYNETDVDWGGFLEEFELPGGGIYLHIQCLRTAFQPYEAQVRLELKGPGPLGIDQVLCEPNYLLDWPYFDGDTTFGARNDHSWYAPPGENRQGESYSLWYNNKRATAGRLFATSFPDRAALTSAETLTDGLVYKWVPAGVTVEPHWDVLFEGDLQHGVTDLAGTPVTPYKTATPGTEAWAKDMGVATPWPDEEIVAP